MGKIIILFFYGNLNFYTGSTFSYYFVPLEFYGPTEELKIVPKGLNIGISLEKWNIFLKINSGFGKAGFKDYFYSPFYDSYRSKINFKEIWGELSVLPYISLKELDFYIGPGVFFSFMNYHFEKINFEMDSIIKSTRIKYSGHLLGFPFIVGIEKKIFKKINFFEETYCLFYGLLNLKWEEKEKKIKREKDYLISGGYSFYIYHEGKLGKMTMGIKYEW